ncbi:MAG: STAS domain-containing protein [Celeribacter sp.]|jgi:anti-sigma B factor antagonist
MKLETEQHGEILLVRMLEPRLDAALAIRFKDTLRTLSAENTPRVLLDLGQVGFLDSSGLGALVAVLKHLQPARTLELANLTPGVTKVFTLTHMDRVFTVHPDVTGALEGGGVARHISTHADPAGATAQSPPCPGSGSA